MRRLRLPEDLRSRLKAPMGELIPGPRESSIARLKQIVKSANPSRIICVGDFVSELVAKSSVPVDLSIIDNRVMRRETKSSRVKAKNKFWTSNPAGTIQMSAWAAISEAMEKPESILIVRGEEDLLALAAMALAPQGALVVYGQPCEGMVAVRVDRAKKSEVKAIVSQMIRE